MTTLAAHLGPGGGVLPLDDFNYLTSCRLLDLSQGGGLRLEPSAEEMGLVILDGSVDLECEGRRYSGLGQRPNLFAGLPTGIYLPRDTALTIETRGARLVGCRAHCQAKTEFAVVEPDQLKVMQVGKDNWSREVRMILGPDSPAQNLLVGETFNPAGNWSGTPPHCHERDNPPHESIQEELYYFEADQPQGWGVQRTYSAPRGVDELIQLRTGTVTLMPWGYHQVVAGPGYALQYCFFLAGPGKELRGCPDPDHQWLLQ